MQNIIGMLSQFGSFFAPVSSAPCSIALDDAMNFSLHDSSAHGIICFYANIAFFNTYSLSNLQKFFPLSWTYPGLAEYAAVHNFINFKS